MMEANGNTIELTPREAEETSMALSDIICWMQGFREAGKDGGPCNLRVLQNLNIVLKDMNWNKRIDTTPGAAE